MYCKKCGAKLNDDALFCPKCGNRVKTESSDDKTISSESEEKENNDKVQEQSNEQVIIEDANTGEKADNNNDELSSEVIIAKQKKTTNIMAITAVMALVLACAFVFIGNPALKSKSNSSGDDEIQNEQKESAEKNESALEKQQSTLDETETVTDVNNSDIANEEYVSALSEIPVDLMDKLKAQTTDNIVAYAASHWEDNVSVAETEYIGSYLLRKKDGINAKYENIIYVVYAVRAAIKTDSGREQNTTVLFYTSFYDLKKSGAGSVETDIGNYQIPGNSFDVTINNDGKKQRYSFTGYENVDSMYKDLVLKSLDQYSCDGEVVYEEVVDNDEESLNEEFGIDPSTVEDYSANLNLEAYEYFDSGIADFNFRYPLYLYNNVTKSEDAFSADYGTNVVTYTFTGSEGSRLIYSLTSRDDSRSIKEMSKYVYTKETNTLIDSADIVNSVSGDHGKVIVTGWEDATKEFIIYDMIKIEGDYILQMKVYMPDFTDDNDKNEKSYVTECDYRYCGFSDSKYAARTYEEYLEANQ
jgi:uncharacterized Zn finger protein (UPF0148 family)